MHGYLQQEGFGIRIAVKDSPGFGVRTKVCVQVVTVVLTGDSSIEYVFLHLSGAADGQAFLLSAEILSLHKPICYLPLHDIIVQ